MVILIHMTIYLVRLNLDIKGKNMSQSLRFRVAVNSVEALSKKNNKVVILSHKGRPKGFDKALSLRPFQALLSKSLGKKVVFLSTIKSAKRIIDKQPAGTVFLLENLRFDKGETENSQKFAKSLASLGDVYINNDFATSHHESASLVGITKYLPSRQGQIIKEETKALTKTLKNPRKPFVLIIGGAKIKDKASTIEKLLPKTSAVLTGGAVANTFLKAAGLDVGKSLYEQQFVKDVAKLMKSKKIMLPTDIAGEKSAILDIGPDTRKEYSRIISQAETIVWAGPMGKFEDKRFAKGSAAVAKAVLGNKKANIIIGGADTFSSLHKRVKRQRVANVFYSTGGGAMLHFLAGGKMPALEAIKNEKTKARK
ncbi:MAG: Phosphoglycerate kinase [Parcubacteria group bacterium GW2011_GWB1_45_7]|uniref:Phosphoglycerate kinase n=4 Tax=Parcubacteria group TaxID=1794811 RepID=A0A0H4TP74_9BACT|nr:pgk, phosphoglycerate kinase, phosphoglycerate kinase [uncultured Parcubacteria bacterium Rifle_16ft_4_minimus_37647]KKU11911.1 MAG: Phosphoglycerate kinase [Parcubacteria group bacterium GW2011_GWB1_45_7]OGY58632.1 MAG: phosphoglycerate kinase [Candidatus Colwellbacteria bacterium RIFCSPHIGHO2_02_FULL_45_17]OGY61727.1 MAG: phosphoglycerate kinase [Candidatus Colwellbacteria bacterium RIFCSPLOWO2_02_FULL_45_11]OGY62701.1 MAG: phosphoglycerate kinase [Candidatus Colwellbacteria bacterium RIFC